MTWNNVPIGEIALQHLEIDEQKHALLLYASGHLLTLYKCIFYFYEFKLKGTRFVQTSFAETPGEMNFIPKFDGFV